MRKLFLLAGITIIFSSCGWLNQSIMFKTKRDYKYSNLADSTKPNEYRVSPNDIFQFSMYTNDGFKLVDLTSLNNTNTGYRFESNLDYKVEPDGTIKLPIIGKTSIAGLTVIEAESFLEEKYSAYYIRPFVIMKITNKRVIVFPGSSGDAKVVPLINNNTTLIEVLALAGGISENGKAQMIKLIRKNNAKEEIYLIDLSKIEGIKQANMVLQANDIIYVEPRRKYASKLLQEITPIISLISSTLVLIWYADRITK